MNKVVSVLMCVYNTPKPFLQEAVESICNQTYTDIEFIIVDDCSEDEEVIKYLEEINKASSNIQLIRNEVNKGLTGSLNIGLVYCTGDYIARMDTDDISLSDRIATQVDYMEAHLDTALVGSGIMVFGEGTEEKEEFGDEECSRDLEVYRIRSLIQHSGPPHPTFMFRSSFLKEHGIKYREDILKAQDYGIMADILKAGGTIHKIHKPLLKYRVHTGQITAKAEMEQKAYQSRVSYDYLRFLFPGLTDAQYAAISLLGCCENMNELIATLLCRSSLTQTCGHILNHKDELERPEVYEAGIKQLLSVNRQKHLFSEKKLEKELRRMWWKKALRMSKEFHHLWWMRPFALGSYRFR